LIHHDTAPFDAARLKIAEVGNNEAMVSIYRVCRTLKLFVRAERKGNWPLHLALITK